MSMTHRDGSFEIKELGQSGQFSGYGSVYGMQDMGDDIVAPGAFTESLSAWQAKGALPAMLWQHRAGEPIGAYTAMSEDQHGLKVSGQLALKTQRGAEAYELLQMKAVSGLSIGFLTREDSMDRKTGVRTIRKADLWEVSLVTFPMNDAARIDQVKSIPSFESIVDFERFLRDTGPYSRQTAMALTTEAKRLFQRDTGTSTGPQDRILAALARQREILRT